MNLPEDRKPHPATETGPPPAVAESPLPPSGSPVMGPAPKPNTAALLAMWGILGALASGGGAIAGAVVGGMSSPPCTGMFCGLEHVFFGGIIGWVAGILGALIAALEGIGTGSDKTVRAMFVMVGVVGLPLMLFVPTAL